MLTLFFLYPMAIAPLLDDPRSEALSWAMFGFSPAAGLVFLTLLPAIRRGRDYVRANGSPWGWAWYPWTLFGVLGFGVAARSALLCWSMHHMPLAATEPYIFGPYFLVPLGLALGVILLEIGLVERHGGVTRAAMVLPVILLLLTMVGHRGDPTYQWFLGRFISRFGGTPLYLTLLATAGFYAYAAARRVPLAFDALTAAIASLAFVTSQTLDLGGLIAPRALPILTAGVAQTAIGLRRRDAWRSLIGAGCLAVSATIALQDTGAASHRGPFAFHLVLAAVLLVGAAFDDRLGRALWVAGSAMALLASLAVVSGRVERTGAIAPWMLDVYPLVVSLTVAGYGYLLGDRPSRAVAGLILCAWLAAVGGRGYGSLRRIVAGLDYLAIGMALFTLAVLTSMAKGGVLPRKMMDRKGKLPDASD